MPPSSSSAYSFKPGGSLKFKGGDTPSSSKKKKRKSRSSTGYETRKGESSSRLGQDDATQDETADKDRENEGADADVEGNADGQAPGRKMTEAERKFDEIRKRRLAERVAKQAKLSHKDRVDAFNRDLESRTEHFEMGRVGGGG